MSMLVSRFARPLVQRRLGVVRSSSIQTPMQRSFSSKTVADAAEKAQGIGVGGWGFLVAILAANVFCVWQEMDGMERQASRRKYQLN